MQKSSVNVYAGICKWLKRGAFLQKSIVLKIGKLLVDYGYLKDTSSMDGAGIDVWVGSGEKRVDAVMCTVDCLKRDSEIKILIGCTEEEKLSVYRVHNETQYMKGIMIRR